MQFGGLDFPVEINFKGEGSRVENSAAIAAIA
jgi:hypothetical protein